MNVKILMFLTIVSTMILNYFNIVLADEYIERNDKDLDNLQSLSIENSRYNNVFIVAGGDVKNLSTINDNIIQQDSNTKHGNQVEQNSDTNSGEKEAIGSPFRSTTTEISSYPSWVQNPNINGYFATAVGSSKYNHEKGLSYQKRMARIQATAELSKIISVQIDNELERTSVHSDGTQIKYNIDQKSRHKSNSKLENVEQLDDWLDPVTNDYYILLGMKIKPVLD